MRQLSCHDCVNCAVRVIYAQGYPCRGAGAFPQHLLSGVLNVTVTIKRKPRLNLERKEKKKHLR